jgi:hypothetical protein
MSRKQRKEFEQEEAVAAEYEGVTSPSGFT